MPRRSAVRCRRYRYCVCRLSVRASGPSWRKCCAAPSHGNRPAGWGGSRWIGGRRSRCPLTGSRTGQAVPGRRISAGWTADCLQCGTVSSHPAGERGKGRQCPDTGCTSRFLPAGPVFRQRPVKRPPEPPTVQASVPCGALRRWQCGTDRCSVR